MKMFYLSLLLIAGLLSLCETKLFYVTLNTSQPCSKSPCHTLNEYARNTTLLAGHIDVSLYFCEGIHNLNHTFLIGRLGECRNPNFNVFFQGQGPNTTKINMLTSGRIYAQCLAHLRLQNMQMQIDMNLTIQSNNFFGKINIVIVQIGYLDIQNCVFEKLKIFVTNFQAFSQVASSNVSIESTYFTKSVEIVSLDEVVIRESRFEDILGIHSQKVEILDCELNNSQSRELSAGVLIWQSNEVSIQNVNVFNTKHFSLALLSVVQGNITNCTIENNTIGIVSDNSTLNLCHSTIIGNAYGVLVTPLDEFTGIQINSFVSDCIFSNNHANGLVLVNTQVNTVLTDCSFYGNRGTPIAAYQSTFELQGETIFRENIAERGGALALINSTVIFGPESRTMFINNTAVEFGGAIYIFSVPIILSLISEILIFVESFLITSISGEMLVNTNDFYRRNCFYQTGKNSRIIFAGNTATLGGYDVFGATVYTQECSPLKFNDTNFEFKTERPDTYKVSSDPTRVCFCSVNNTAQCENRDYITLNVTAYPGETFTVPVVLSGYDFGRVAGSVYTNVLGKDHVEVIDSESRQHLQGVDLMECTNLNYTVYSDQTSEPVFLVLTTHEQITNERDKDEIKETIENVFSASCEPNENFPCTAMLTTPVYIKVSLRSCPLGFTLINRSCRCDENIQNISSNCNNQDNIGIITRQGTRWVGVDTRENSTDTYYWHSNCPRDYCSDSETSIQLTSPDGQCSSNRAGVLCGECQVNYSLQLGGNKCIPECNDSTVSLLIVFAALGILLVVFIKLLDLTVSSGTINGLIFYANVVWSNNAILFSLQDRQNVGYYIITLPIAWINLDFGIEACFSASLDQLAKTGLQFVFPVYIWCIAGLIILISHYSTRATKLFGNNSVSVLATLFLLSYGKLLRNITNVFVFADVNKFNDTNRKVWSLDGNIRYGETAGHIVLMVMALLFLILFLLPFTLTLLLVPFLRAKSHLRPLRWINKLKPFFDTYYGPFKDKRGHQVWTGILLMSRVLILAVFSSTSTDSPIANILLMTVLTTVLQLYSASVGLLYKKWALSMLEMLYLSNLIILGGATMFYLPLPQKEQNNTLSPVVTTSVCIALAQFIGTVVFHVIKRILSIGWIQEYLEKRKEDLRLAAEDKLPAEQVVQIEVGEREPTVHIVEINKHVTEYYDSTVFRETLLENSTLECYKDK